MNKFSDKNEEVFTSVSSSTSTQASNSINSSQSGKDGCGGNAWVSGSALRDPWRLDRTLGNLLLRAVKQSPEHGIKTYELSGGENWISYPDFYVAAEIAARNFLAKGLKPGDKVILQTRGTSSTLLISWACFLSGVVAVPMPPLVTLNRDAAAVRRLRSVWEFLGHSPIIVEESFAKSLSAFAVNEGWGELRLLQVEALLRAPRSAPDIALPVIHPDDLALMPLTSGSTGMPKAVQLTHRNILAMSAGTCQQNSFHAGDISFNWMPLDHPGALVMLGVVPMDVGASQIHVPTASILENILLWLELIDRSKATISWAPNFAFSLLSDALARSEQCFDLSTMRFLINGGEHVSPETLRDVLNRMAERGFMDGALRPAFGMAETSSAITYSSGLFLQTVSEEYVGFVSLGGPIPGAELRVVGENGEVLNEGEVGFLQLSRSFCHVRLLQQSRS